jgi:sulfur carrier protein
VIQVNGRDFEWVEGLTIQAILEAHRYSSPRIVVKVNGKVVRQPEWPHYVVADGDDVRAIHLIAGG